MGISCHLGLTKLDLSNLNIELDTESLELILAALSSNTALSLTEVPKINLKFLHFKVDLFSRSIYQDGFSPAVLQKSQT